MNTTVLRYVVEVNRVRSISKAAQNLYMGQPNLSRAIKDLEAELGITIFKRTAKGVTPTPRGEEFLAYAQSITAQLDELESLYRPHSTTALELNVAVPRASYVAAAFADFLNGRVDREHINVHFRETDANNTVNLVASGDMDFGIIRYQVRHEGYFQQLLAENQLDSRGAAGVQAGGDVLQGPPLGGAGGGALSQAGRVSGDRPRGLSDAVAVLQPDQAGGGAGGVHEADLHLRPGEPVRSAPAG